MHGLLGLLIDAFHQGRGLRARPEGWQRSQFDVSNRSGNGRCIVLLWLPTVLMLQRPSPCFWSKTHQVRVPFAYFIISCCAIGKHRCRRFEKTPLRFWGVVNAVSDKERKNEFKEVLFNARSVPKVEKYMHGRELKFCALEQLKENSFKTEGYCFSKDKEYIELFCHFLKLCLVFPVLRLL